ncbi:MAG: tRNA (adenosine(37)-N6)-threonylcarbamoyltransferase complex dimerization subunit type 1 TsaB [Symploca sp. SIO2G7]|nr:tRNA (adenosine(37)-N6)-threonylcarbamoyltransferase complex dimerization subunit type 1 TsaB [Symploca sp. SIO2G7]
MNLLAIDTATDTCSVALKCGEALLSCKRYEPRAHGRLVLPWIGELLSEAGIIYSQLDALAIDRGPGGFTSLRIGLSIAQGIALAHDLPLLPVSSLAALAYNGQPDGFSGRLLTAFDARLGELYAASFEVDRTHIRLIGREQLCRPADIGQIVSQPPDAAAGNAFNVYAGALADWSASFKNRINSQAIPDANAVVQLASESDATDAVNLQPVYLRDEVTNIRKTS